MNKFLLITLSACLPLALGFAAAQRSPALASAPAGVIVQTLPQLPGEPQLIPNTPPDVAGCVWYYRYGWTLVCMEGPLLNSGE